MTVSSAINFYDAHPKPADFYSEVIDGLRRQPRYIPPKFFYDQKGSQLFDQICELPEYYPTRTETTILQQNAEEIADLIGEECLLLEPGSGSSQKVRLLLDALRPSAYVPMDISKAHLINAANTLSKDFPWLDIHATCIDFTAPLELEHCPATAHRVAFFPGSSIGNFEPHAAVQFLHNLAEIVGHGGGLLIGVDVKKDERILNAAYNDKQGVTAAFNLNLLERINRELSADFVPEQFSHYAKYNDVEGRIEMHLKSNCIQTIRIDDEQFRFSPGEGIHTENSYKYSIDEFSLLAEKAGFSNRQVWTDDDDLFSVHYFEYQG